MKIYRKINENTWYSQDANDYFSSYGSKTLDIIMGICLLFPIVLLLVTYVLKEILHIY